MQEYRSGHNEAVLKTVWVKAHGGSNPSSCAKRKDEHLLVLFLGYKVLKMDSRRKLFVKAASISTHRL